MGQIMHMKTLKENSHLDKYIERFWKYQIDNVQTEDVELTVKDVDQKVHTLIH